MKRKTLRFLTPALAVAASHVQAQTQPLSAAINYQGQLNNNGNPAVGSYDLDFSLFSDSNAANQVGVTFTNPATVITNGLFSVPLDFGAAAFTGSNLWLRIGVRTNGSSAEFTTLSPLQPIMPVPYALYTPSAGVANQANTVVSNAVSPSQLNTLKAPSANQVLAFDGAELAWTNVSPSQLNTLKAPLTNQVLAFDGAELAWTNVSPSQLNTLKAPLTNQVLAFDGAELDWTSVSPSQLNTLKAPSANQVLAFDGAEFAWTSISPSQLNTLKAPLTNQVLAFDGAELAWTNASQVSQSWLLNGSAGTSPTNGNFIGTTDNQPLELWVNDERALRLEPGVVPNVIGGFNGNLASNGVIGAVIDGGGAANGGTNVVAGNFDTVGGGRFNRVYGQDSVLAGGSNNVAIAESDAIGGGGNNNASGSCATVPGGYSNSAVGAYSFAAGQQALANNQGDFVWSDSQNALFSSTTNDEFSVRAQNGVRIQSGVGVHLDPVNGAPVIVRDWDVFATNAGYPKAGVGRWGLFQETQHLTLGIPNDRFGDFQVAEYSTNGGYTMLMQVDQSGDITNMGNIYTRGNVYANGVQLTSDRSAKENFEPLDCQSVLAKVAALPLSEWNYKGDAAEQRHIGPMAQDFHAAFGLDGADDRHISVVDEGGVALAAIQALNRKLDQRDRRLTTQEQTLELLLKDKDAKIQALHEQLDQLQKAVDRLSTKTHN